MAECPLCGEQKAEMRARIAEMARDMNALDGCWEKKLEVANEVISGLQGQVSRLGEKNERFQSLLQHQQGILQEALEVLSPQDPNQYRVIRIQSETKVR